MENNQPNIELIKRDIRSIRTAGANTETFGWILLVIGPIIIWLLNNKNLVFAVAFVLFVLGFYFVYTGKYIKVGRGNKTQSLLRLNSFVSIPLCLAVVPIYICILSFKNYAKFKNLPPQIQDLYNKPKARGFAWWQIVILILILVAGIESVVLKLKDINQAASAPATSQVEVAKVDTVSKSHFTINFPADYTATDFTKQVSGHFVPYTAYVSPKNNSEVYDLYVTNFPSKDFHYDTMTAKSLAAANHTALLNIVEDLHGKLVKSAPATFANYTTEEGEFSSQTLSGSLTCYIRVFFVGNYQYSIATIGADKASFDIFANSFKYK